MDTLIQPARQPAREARNGKSALDRLLAEMRGLAEVMPARDAKAPAAGPRA